MMLNEIEEILEDDMAVNVALQNRKKKRRSD